MDERMKRQMSFLLEIDRMKEIQRQTYLADGTRRENDAEHSFHLAVMAYLLAEYCEEKVDREKAMMMGLVHDMVEIDAGDTYAYDPEGAKTKEEREMKAADRIFGMLPDDQGSKLRALWNEFEERKTPEAEFVNTLDRLQPILLTDAADGKSWKEHGVRRSWVEKRNQISGENCSELGKLVHELIHKNVESGNIKDE